MSINEKITPQQKITRYRSRLAAARFEALINKTGSNCILVNLPDGTMATVEVSERSLIEALQYFEGIAYGEYRRDEAEQLLITCYSSSLTKHGDKLTESGNAFMNDLIKQAVMMMKETGAGSEHNVH